MKRTLLRGLAASALAVAGTCAVVATPAQAGSATMVVQAVDAKNGNPIADFCAYVDWTTYLCSNGSGQVTFPGLAGGAHDIWLSPDDKFHMTTQTTASIADTGSTTVAVPVRKGGKISTVVSDAVTGLPIAGACAYAQPTGDGLLPDGYLGCSDDTGLLVTRLVLPGSYQLFVMPPAQGGYGAQWVGAAGGTGQQSLAPEITVTASTTAAGPATHLDLAAPVSGTVADAVTGAPVGNAIVATNAFDPGTGVQGGDSGVTDAAGHYVLSRLGPYDWPLLVVAPAYAQQWTGGTGNRNHATLVPLAPGGTTYDIALKRGVPVSGSVTVGGVPMASGRIVAYNAGTGDVVGSDDFTGGAYSMLLAGSQNVKLLVYDANGTGTGVWFGGTDLGSATTVTVPSKTPLTADVPLP